MTIEQPDNELKGGLAYLRKPARRRDCWSTASARHRVQLYGVLCDVQSPITQRKQEEMEINHSQHQQSRSGWTSKTRFLLPRRYQQQDVTISDMLAENALGGIWLVVDIQDTARVFLPCIFKLVARWINISS